MSKPKANLSRRRFAEACDELLANDARQKADAAKLDASAARAAADTDLHNTNPAAWRAKHGYPAK